MNRIGPSTGSCAAAAAKAAALHARRGVVGECVDVPLPGGGRLEVPILAWGGHRRRPWASVRKPATDDPDATRGVVVVVSLRPAAGLSFRAGPGVGVVGRPGLALPPGEAAINPGPRAQIGASLREVGGGSWTVTVSVPTGAVVASRTFNGKLGIEGGISILGTAGVVRPWCEQAMVQAVRTHLDVVRAAGQSVALLVPGHMGAAAARRCFPRLEAVEVGNAWGASLDVLRTRGFREAVLVGHAGKLVKLAQGQWNTHSGAGSSAASWASRLLRRCRGVRFAGDTLEELVKTAGRSDVDLLAEAVARAVCRRSGLGVRVLFTDLAGEIVGEGEKQ